MTSPNSTSNKNKSTKKKRPDYVTSLLKNDSSPQNLMEHLNTQMASVPGFKPPAVNQKELKDLTQASSFEETNQFRSAAVFLKSLAAEVRAWRKELPNEYRPAIIAVLHGGIQIQVQSLAQVSFDGIRIEGSLAGSPCSLLAHQSTVQMLCHAIEINPEEEPSRPIGFIWSDHNDEV